MYLVRDSSLGIVAEVSEDGHDTGSNELPAIARKIRLDVSRCRLLSDRHHRRFVWLHVLFLRTQQAVVVNELSDGSDSRFIILLGEQLPRRVGCTADFDLPQV